MSPAATASMNEPGVLRLAGVLDYRSGPALRKQGQALLLAFMRDAQAAGKRCQVQGLPDDMRDIAQVYDLDEVLAS